MSQLISVNKLAKSFAGKTLFTGVQFGIFEKDRIGFVGPNGAGKSTLLKILVGLETPDAGEVVKRKGLRLAYLPQTPTFGEGDTLLSALMDSVDHDYDHLHKAYEYLSKLELDQFGEDFMARQLSGGWQKKLAIARELMKDPELFIFDEPTNHLDVTSILWLEEFINSSGWASVVITHDRLFLQRISNKIFDLDPQNPNPLICFNGDYLKYLDEKELLLAGQRSREDKLRNVLTRETEWLRRGAKARQTKQKARIERADDLSSEVKNLADKNRQRNIEIEFKDADRNPQKLIELKNISKKLGERILFQNINFLVTPKTRLALLGDNGCGKSTLLKMIVGEQSPDSGEIYRADKLKISYFEQTRETLNFNQSVLKNICPEGDYVDFQGQYVFGRSYLERFQFPRQQHDLPVGKLSGGEQARLRIAQMMLQKAQVLILDEPTNDLDLNTLLVLQDALSEFNGAVILVTHDRFFMDAVAKEILAFVPVSNTENRIEKFSGYFQWEEWFSQWQQTKQSPQKLSETSDQISVAASEDNNSTAKKKKLSFKDQRDYETIEAKILQLEDELAEKEKLMHLPETVANSSKVSELYTEVSSLQKEIEKLYARWAELEKLVKE